MVSALDTLVGATRTSLGLPDTGAREHGQRNVRPALAGGERDEPSADTQNLSGEAVLANEDLHRVAALHQLDEDVGERPGVALQLLLGGFDLALHLARVDLLSVSLVRVVVGRHGLLS